MPRSIEAIKQGKKVQDLRKEAAEMFKKSKHPFIVNGMEYAVGDIQSSGRKDDCINYISAVEVLLEQEITPVPQIEATAVEEVVEVETVADVVETAHTVTPQPTTIEAEQTDYSNSEAEKLAIAKKIYYSTDKKDELMGLREYHQNLCITNKLFTPDFAILVARSRVIIEKYSDEKSQNGKAHPGSIVANKVTIMKAIADFAKQDNDKFEHPTEDLSLVDTFNTFDAAMRGAFRDISAEKHKLNKAMNDSATIDVREIKAKSFLDWAIDTVSNLPPLPNGTREDRANGAKWKQIAIALMLLTGRRQSEVMSSGIFKYVDESLVNFEGQLKRHVDEVVEARNIPVLGKMGKQIIDAINWLESYGKRTIPKGREQADLQLAAKKSHDLCSKYISESMDDLAELCPIQNGKSWEYSDKGKVRSKFKGHLCRQLYAEICAGVFHDDSESKKRAFITEILIESSSSASLPYDRDVKISDMKDIKTICGEFVY